MPLADTTPGMLRELGVERLTEARMIGWTVIEVLLWKRHLHHEHIFRVEARIDTEQTRDADDHDARAGERDQRQRDLGRDQAVAQSASRARDRPARVLFQRVRKIFPEGRHRGRQAKEDTGEERKSRGETQDVPIELDRVHGAHRDERQVAGKDRDEETRAPRRDDETAGAARASQKHALDQELAHDAAAARAHGGPNRKLSLARRGARQHEIRHVHAGDQQYEPDDPEHRVHDGAQLASPRIRSWAGGRRSAPTSPAYCRSFDMERPIVSISLRACASVTFGFRRPMQMNEFEPGS